MRRILLISLFMLMLVATEARADVVVIVRRQAEASGNYVRICDVARVEGPTEQVAEVAATVLGPTPPKGQAREITRWDIESRLFEMGVAARVIFTGNDMVQVFGQGTGGIRPDFGDDDVALLRLQPVGAPGGAGEGGGRGDISAMAMAGTGSNLTGSRASETRQDAAGNPAAALESMPAHARDRVEQAISRYLSKQYKRSDVEVESHLVSVSEAVPYSAHEVEVADAVNGRVPGRAALRLRVRETPDAPARQVLVAADTEVFAQAPVAAKPLYKGDILEAKDVILARVKMESGKTYLPPSPKAAAGRELKRNVMSGEPLLASEAIIGEAVRRGEFVENVAAGAGWELRSTGKALGGGMVGDTITVEDAGNKTRYKARITGRGTVVVLPKSKYEM